MYVQTGETCTAKYFELLRDLPHMKRLLLSAKVIMNKQLCHLVFH